MRVSCGLTVLLNERRHLLEGARLALFINHTSLTDSLRPSPLALNDLGLEVRVLLGPEHGLFGTHQDMEAVPAGRDPIFDLPVHSLYGSDVESLAPPGDLLAEIDTIVFDIQDIGARYYTYLASLKKVMEMAARHQKRVIVCDRPNPIGGIAMEGNLVAPEFESFVGCGPLPNRHSLTAGEFALLFSAVLPELDLHVSPMKGWRREMYFEDTGLTWVAPSPNMPTPKTALVYPGMCLLEGTNVSEGRGTTRPFELFGAPFVSPRALVDKLESAKLPGVRFRPTLFRPMFQKYAGLTCGGAAIHVTERTRFRPVLTGLTVLAALHALHPHDFQWRHETYEYVSHLPAIDLLAGGSAWRRGIENGRDPQRLLEECRADLDSFTHRVRKILLYDSEEWPQ